MIKNEDFELPKHPMETEIKNILSALDLFVWGDYVADASIHTDYENDSCFTINDLHRKSEAEFTWIWEQAQDVAKEYPETAKLDTEFSVDYEGSTLYPPTDAKLQLVKTFCNTLDAFIMGNHVVIGSYFKNTLPEAFDYQTADFWEHERQFE
tara:strand:+ start:6126 stop:6581 length:456 start_codon:yes stop_codon:yes gene_type:complete